MNIDKVVEYHNKKIKNFQLYKQITANKNYVFPESNNQFNTIARKSNTLQMFRLVNRIFKRFQNKSNKKKSIHYIINLLYQDKTDVEKYEELEIITSDKQLPEKLITDIKKRMHSKFSTNFMDDRRAFDAM